LKWRELEDKGLSQSTTSAPAMGRRPPEKEQYADKYGLSNALHIALDTKAKSLFEFLINLKIDMHH
jgi:hypothetical protein